MGRMPTGTPRARPLPPEERRAAIIDAVLPLLLQRGASVTTSEMAEAAGVAEGTIFRAFPDKTAIIHEAIHTMMDPAPTIAAIDTISRTLTLERQLTEAAEILSHRSRQMATLFGMLRSLQPTPRHSPTKAHQYVSNSIDRITDALAGLLEPHREHLSLGPQRAAMALQSLVITNSHPLIASDRRLSVDEMAAVVAHGVLKSVERAGI